ncbi:MAG: helix-turn-helix domain-containing protein [Myxococcales bacterium]|nr:MAG: helix-turn-helix domain-containing protein [Myxococcales bacterium]
MHEVAVLALPGVLPFDLGTPCGVFRYARLPGGRLGYRVQVCGPARDVPAGEFTVRVAAGLEALQRADTIVVPGVDERHVAGPFPEKALRALQAAASSGTRVASICSGAFVLAAAGLLNDGPATTHWLAAPELARRYPRVQVDPDVLYVQRGNVFTSAGAAAGLDLCLHLVRLDYGSAVAADSARLAVMPLERAGGQSQFIVNEPPTPEGASLAPLLQWLESRLADPVSLEAIAKRAGLSVRTLSRRFREQTGMSPVKWLLRARVREAQSLLETTSASVEQIATRVGFGSATSLREHFQKLVATTPQAYRRAFRSAPAA